MKKTIQTMAAGAALLSASSIALAVDIGGLNVPVGPTFSVGQIYENVPTAIGDTLSGYGKVDSINSTAVGSLCIDCELTFQFGGYTLSSISATEIKFSGGFITFYLGFGADNDFSTSNAGGSAGDLVEATNGALFLTLAGHAIDAAGNTFVGIGANIGTVVPTGFGSGLLDVDTSAGGIANTFFDTNSIPALFGGGNADLELGSSFSGLHPVYPDECPGGPACVRGSVDTIATVVVPEPGTYTLMLAGLGLLGFVAGRRKL
jgi:PEP-CTERM motif